MIYGKAIQQQGEGEKKGEKASTAGPEDKVQREE